MAASNDPSDEVRVRVIYRGRVQGVGFRYTTLEISHDYSVSGYVRNMSDGSVELEAQGAAEAVGAFLTTIARQLAGNIRDATRSDATRMGGERGFVIRY